MKKTLVSLAAVAAMALSGAAFAGESSGKIKMIDPATNTLILEDGTTYQVSEKVAIDRLKPGQEVTVSFETKDGRNQASNVTVAK